MTEGNLLTIFSELRVLRDETEWVEFKEAKGGIDFDLVGRLFSALSNGSNLNGQRCGWLVLGVTDKPPRQVVGTAYKNTKKSLDELKTDIAKGTNHRITVKAAHELVVENKRVIMLEIPSAPAGIPTEWRGVAYGRHNDSTRPLTVDQMERIRWQYALTDWSAEICADATFDNLDPAAISAARVRFKEKYPHLAADVDLWNDLIFLNKTKLTVSGKLTRAAIILLGRPESISFLRPSVAEITWMVKDHTGKQLDYHHFGPPLLLAVEQVFGRIRNLTHRYMPANELFPVEVSQYDPWVLRETLHNAIAHQDYLQCSRIVITEEPDSLIFANHGHFLPESVEAVIRADAPAERYRNKCLADGMVALKMIDTIGSGILKMFETQRKRNFPLPDYDISRPQNVVVRIAGKIIDEKYTRMLMARSDLDIWDVMALDKVQKRKRLTEAEFKRLKHKRLIEGSRTKPIISADVATATDSKADYIKNRGLDKDHLKMFVVKYLQQFKEGSRVDFERLLLTKISDALTVEQKKNFVRNLLQEMKREGTIDTIGRKRWSRWVLSMTNPNDETKV